MSSTSKNSTGLKMDVEAQEEDRDKECHVEGDGGDIYDEDVRGKDGCDQADGDEEYRGEDMNAARRNTRRTVARMAAARRTKRSTAVRKAVARPTGPRRGRPRRGGGPRSPTAGRVRRRGEPRRGEPRRGEPRRRGDLS